MLDVTKPALRDDWTAYLAAADEREEAGDLQKAKVLRRQGETLRVIADHLDPATYGRGCRSQVSLVSVSCCDKVICTNTDALFVLRFYVRSFQGLLLLARKVNISKHDMHYESGYLARRVREEFRRPFLAKLFAETP